MQDRSAAQLVGIDVDRVAAITFGIGVVSHRRRRDGLRRHQLVQPQHRVRPHFPPARHRDPRGASGASAVRSVAAVAVLVAEDVVAVVWSPDLGTVCLFRHAHHRAVRQAIGAVRPGGCASAVTRSGLAKIGGVVVALARAGRFPAGLHEPERYHHRRVHPSVHGLCHRMERFSGYSGYISLGHAAFFGTGAYILAILAQRFNIPAGESMFALVPVAGLGAAVVAVPFGLIALRTRRHTFVVITIAVFFTFQLLAFNLSITQGSSGIQVPSPNWAAATYNNPYYYVALGIVVFATAMSWGMRRSVFGLQLLAIRDDEDRARGFGSARRPGQARRLCDFGRAHRHVRRRLCLLPGPNFPAVRLQPSFRPFGGPHGPFRGHRAH